MTAPATEDFIHRFIREATYTTYMPPQEASFHYTEGRIGAEVFIFLKYRDGDMARVPVATDVLQNYLREGLALENLLPGQFAPFAEFAQRVAELLDEVCAPKALYLKVRPHAAFHGSEVVFDIKNPR